MQSMTLILSLFPFVIFLVLLLVKRTSLLLASGFTFVLVLVETLLFWQILPGLALVSLVKGSLVALDIFIIIFGAVFFLEILKSLGIINSIFYYLESFSKDYRIQVILLAWFFESFIEGTAGFGTPSAIIAPILISFGLSPLTAVVISLLGNSTSVAFGAAGTPIRVGLAGLDITSVPLTTALINCAGFIVPIFMLWVLISDLKKERAHFWEGLPFAVWSGIAFVIPSVLMVFLGQEFPSILGAIIGIFLVFITTKLKIFVPKNCRSFSFEKREGEALPLFKVIFPYGLLIILLIAGKLLVGSAGIVISSAKHTFSFYNPGFAFILAGLPVALFWGREKNLITTSVGHALKRSVEPFLVIVFMSSMVQLMINSNNNFSGLPSSLELIAKTFENPFLPFMAPVIGAFGSFITGSATVSNIMFGSFFNTAAKAIDVNPALILSLGLVGAAAGNMIALADMLAAETAVGFKDGERSILRKVILPCLLYVFLVGLIGLLIAGKI